MSEYFHQLEKLFSQSQSFQPPTLELFIRQSQETLSINSLVDDEPLSAEPAREPPRLQ